MSEVAYRLFEETLSEQHRRNEARRIRARVTEARRSVSSAGPRWPFELLQNALDAGPRAGKSSVAIRLSCEEARVAFEHDGAPFTSNDLTALLSGGSSKDFESEETTGRFGTGFLVTHVLAERTGLRGLLETPDGFEQFDLVLDRGGDEEAILTNMEDCTEAIRSANPVSDLHGVESARFEYYIGDDSSLTLGIASLRAALPYLYATRKVLGRVELQNEKDGTEIWVPTEVATTAIQDGYVEQRSLHIHKNGTDFPEIQVFRFMTSDQGLASALVLLERTTNGWRVIPPESNSCRVYREYPLSGSGILPFNFILDGKFEPDQERSRPLMGEEDKSLLRDAFTAAVAAVRYAFANNWEDAHLLVQARAPERGFDTANVVEKQWWDGQLLSFATRVATLPVVECSSGMLPAIAEDGAYADFIVPSLLAESSDSETTVERVWPLFESATDLLPPRAELAVAWSEIAQGWHSLGMPINRISVKELPKWVSGEADTVSLRPLQVEHLRKDLSKRTYPDARRAAITGPRFARVYSRNRSAWRLRITAGRSRLMLAARLIPSSDR